MVIKKEDLTYEKIFADIGQVYRGNYGSSDTGLVEMVFNDIVALFLGKKKGFQRCDTPYHDLFHTLQVAPPFIGILDGWNKSGKTPCITKDYFDLGLIGVLLHDTGYIKREGDSQGNGGKYTFVHIQRSIDFAEHYLPQIGFDTRTIESVKNIIMCTGVRVDYSKLHFNLDEERIVGYALGTSDLIGQMSAIDYPEKLSALFDEFEEAYRFEGKEKLESEGAVIFQSVGDLINSTPHFYEVVVKDKFQKMGSLDACLTYHYNDSHNPYLEAIEENMQRIKLAAAAQ
ncbi:MAG: hypothetical protein RDU01_10135 [Thermodesulfovibrionales bacterium]|nr:hypothetical protein [Thermodesulfovibrionales bacterium]